MTLKSAAFFAVVGMALWTVRLALTFFNSLSGVLRGFAPAAALLTSLIQLIAVVSLLVFFVVFYRSQSR
jgi:hypothetical protein